MTDAVTTREGPLGSTIHVLRADAGTIAELPAIDWNRHFRRNRALPLVVTGPLAAGEPA